MASRLRRSLVEHAPLVAAVALIVWRLHAYLPLHTLPARGDPSLRFRAGDLTSQWVPWLRVAIDALWRHGTLAFWDPFTNGGSPEFESPQAGVVSLTTLLGAVAPVEAAVKWSILAHILGGMVGVYALSRRLRTSASFAAIGAVSFGLGTYLLDHLYVGHLDHIYAMGLTPWAILLIWIALEAPHSWWRPAAGAGIVLGLESLEGATSAMVYSLMACCLVVVGVIGPGWKRSTLRLGGVGAIAAACFFLTAAPQLLPMLTYLPVTGRGGGLSLSQSSVVVREVMHPAPTITAVIVMSLGLGGLWARGQRRAALWLGAVVAVGLAAANVDAVYAGLWRYFPGVRYQRIPQRALVLVGIAAPPLVAAGAETMWRLLSRWKTAGVLLASAGLVWFIYESWTIAPGTPPMTDTRVERQHNQAMRWLAEHAGGTRIALWEPPTRHWQADNITVPLGLEPITSYTPSEHHDYLLSEHDPPERRTFLADAYASPARFWGLLNVRYVVSTSRRSEPGFTLATTVPRCPVDLCQPSTSAGPYIYENKKWMPRAWMVRRAIGLVGPPQSVFEAALDVMRMPGFDPAHLALLQLRPGAAAPRVDALFGVDTDVPGALRWRTGRADDALERILRPSREPLEPAGVRRISTNRVDVSAPSDGWLVASEKFSLYAGWKASIKRRPLELFRADGVLTAMNVRSGDIVRLSYEPPRFRLGAALLITMLAAIAVAEVRSRRRSQTDRGVPVTAQLDVSRDTAATV